MNRTEDPTLVTVSVSVTVWQGQGRYWSDTLAQEERTVTAPAAVVGDLLPASAINRAIADAVKRAIAELAEKAKETEA